jgi:hypothetical protein
VRNKYRDTFFVRQDVVEMLLYIQNNIPRHCHFKSDLIQLAQDMIDDGDMLTTQDFEYKKRNFRPDTSHGRAIFKRHLPKMTVSPQKKKKKVGTQGESESSSVLTEEQHYVGTGNVYCRAGGTYILRGGRSDRLSRRRVVYHFGKMSLVHERTIHVCISIDICMLHK